MDSIVARHELDNELEARGLRTEFETRALLVARAPPNGEWVQHHVFILIRLIYIVTLLQLQ